MYTIHAHKKFTITSFRVKRSIKPICKMNFVDLHISRKRENHVSMSRCMTLFILKVLSYGTGGFYRPHHDWYPVSDIVKLDNDAYMCVSLDGLAESSNHIT